MLDLKRLAPADRDLDDIWLWIAADSIDAANRLVRNVEAAERRLAEFPELGRARNDLAKGHRSWPVGNYLLVYVFDDQALTIVRVLHGARDLSNSL